MINVAALKPTDIEHLSDIQLSADDKRELLTSIRQMLIELRPDNGANSDRIYMAAQMLDMAKVWDRIGPEELASTILLVNSENRRSFLEGLPHGYAAEVSFSIVTAPHDGEIAAVALAEFSDRNTGSVGAGETSSSADLRAVINSIEEALNAAIAADAGNLIRERHIQKRQALYTLEQEVRQTLSSDPVGFSMPELVYELEPEQSAATDQGSTRTGKE